MSWLGGIGGGRGVIGFGWDILLVSLRNLIVMGLAMRCALGAKETAVMMERMDRTSLAVTGRPGQEGATHGAQSSDRQRERRRRLLRMWLRNRKG